MKMNKVEVVALIALILVLVFILTGCNTVAGVGKDIQGSAEWTKEKVTQPSTEKPAAK
jgi:predicted small secreted protein